MIWLILLGVIVAYIALSLTGMALALRRTTDILKTAPTQVGAFHAGNPASTPLRILLTGDSIPAAAGIGSFEESLGGLIAAHFAPHRYVTLDNRSVVGLRMAGLARQQITSGWDAIVVLVGANDSLRLTDYSAFAANLDRALSQLSRAGKKVILTGPGEPSVIPAFPFWVRWYLQRREKKLRALMSGAAAQCPNVTYLDPHAALSGVDWHDPKYLSRDRFHPSAAGHRVWFEIIEPELDRSAH